MQRANSLVKTLMLGKIEGKRRMGRQRMRWLDGIIDSKDMSLSKLWEIEGQEGMLQSMGCKELDVTERLYSSFLSWNGSSMRVRIFVGLVHSCTPNG